MPFEESLLEPIKKGFDPALLEPVKTQSFLPYAGSSEIGSMPPGMEFQPLTLPRVGFTSQPDDSEPVGKIFGVPETITSSMTKGGARKAAAVMANAAESAVEGALHPATPAIVVAATAAPEVVIPALTAQMSKSGGTKLGEAVVDFQQGRDSEGVRKAGEATTELFFAAAPALKPSAFSPRLLEPIVPTPVAESLAPKTLEALRNEPVRPQAKVADILGTKPTTTEVPNALHGETETPVRDVLKPGGTQESASEVPPNVASEETGARGGEPANAQESVVQSAPLTPEEQAAAQRQLEEEVPAAQAEPKPLEQLSPREYLAQAGEVEPMAALREHYKEIERAYRQRKPINAEAADKYEPDIPGSTQTLGEWLTKRGYKREGDLYVRDPEAPLTEPQMREIAQEMLPKPNPPEPAVAPAEAPATPPPVAEAKAQAEVARVAQTEGKRSAKDVKAELVSRLEQEIENAPSERELASGPNRPNPVKGEMQSQREQQPKVTIEIPGDGTFTVFRTKEALGEVLARAKRIQTNAEAKTSIPRGAVKSSEVAIRKTYIERREPPQEPRPGPGAASPSETPAAHSDEVTIIPEEPSTGTTAGTKAEKIPPGPGAASPSEFAPEKPFTTSIQNAVTAEKRGTRGMPAVEEEAARQWGTVWDEVKRTVEEDPGAGPRLVAELKAKPRPVSDREDALLLHEQVSLEELHNRTVQRMLDAAETEGASAIIPELRVLLDHVSDQLLDLYNVNKSVGRETARGLNARKMISDENYTLAKMETIKRAMNDGRKLTKEELDEIAALHDKIAKTQKAFDDYVIETQKKLKAIKSKDRLDVEAMRLKRQAELAKSEYYKNLAKDRFNALSPMRKAFHYAGGAWDIVRTIITSYDLSALLRQGRFIVMSRPLLASKSFVPMMRALMSKDYAYRVDQEIVTRPNYPIYRQSKLYLAEHGQPLSKMEEAYMSSFIERMEASKYFVLRQAVRPIAATQRAYTTFLNKLRADTFDTLSATLSRHEPMTPVEGEAVANYVNAATGRGSLGAFERAAVGLNRVFFAPRYVASRFQMILGQPLWRGTGRTRSLIAQEYARALIGYAVFYATAKMALPDSEVETDPRSSDAGKIVIGNTRIDPLAGLQQNTVFLTRLGTGETLDQRGHIRPLRGEQVKYGGRTEEDVIMRFLRSKLAPVPGTMVDVVTGKDFSGDPVTFGSALQSLTVPIAYRDILKVMEDQGVPRGTALAILSIFGEGLQVYDQ